MLKQIKNLILDMDGVLWHGDRPQPGLSEFFAILHTRGIHYVLATNNASKTPEQYVQKLARFQVSVSPEQVLTSAEATGSYLATQYPKGAVIYVVGGEGLRQAIGKRGFRLLGDDEVLAGGKATAVAVGFNREITYDQFAAGTLLIARGADFIGTNPDVTFPSEFGKLPGAGSFLALIQTATGVKPTVIGKPGPIIFQDALRRLKGTTSDTAMVGDRLETDIAGGKAAGISTILLLSGISTRAQAENGQVYRPDYIFSDIQELARNL